MKRRLNACQLAKDGNWATGTATNGLCRTSTSSDSTREFGILGHAVRLSRETDDFMQVPVRVLERNLGSASSTAAIALCVVRRTLR